jgi:hypothetical protein
MKSFGLPFAVHVFHIVYYTFNSHTISSSIEFYFEQQQEEAPAAADTSNKSESSDFHVLEVLFDNEASQSGNEETMYSLTKQTVGDNAKQKESTGSESASQQLTKRKTAPTNRQCIVEGCLKYRGNLCEQMCRRHYNQWNENKAKEPSKKRQKFDLRDCSNEMPIKAPPASHPMIPSEDLNATVETAAVERTKNAPGKETEDEDHEAQRGSSSQFHCSMGGCPRFLSKGCNQIGVRHFNQWKMINSSRKNESSGNDTKPSQGRSPSPRRKCIAEGCNRNFVSIQTNRMCSHHFEEFLQEAKRSASVADGASSNDPNLHRPISKSSNPTGSLRSSASIELTTQLPRNPPTTRQADGDAHMKEPEETEPKQDELEGGIDEPKQKSPTLDDGEKGASIRRQCRVRGCGRYSQHHSRLCSKHLRAWKEAMANGLLKVKVAAKKPPKTVLVKRTESQTPFGSDHGNEMSDESPLSKRNDSPTNRTSPSESSQSSVSSSSTSSHRTCEYPGCHKYSRGKSKNYMCWRHYNESKISGEGSNEDDHSTNSSRSSASSLSTARSTDSNRLCTIPECQKYHRGKGTNFMCTTHYRQLNSCESNSNGGETDEKSMRQCTISGCEKYFIGRKTNCMCRSHFKELMASSLSSDSTSDSSDLSALSDLSDSDDQSQDSESTRVQCTIIGCEDEAIAPEDYALCEDHLLKLGTNPPTELIHTGEPPSDDNIKLCDEYEKCYDSMSLGSADGLPPGHQMRNQYWFVKIRRELLRLAKKEQNKRIMKRRLEREASTSPLKKLLNGESMIPAPKAKQIMHNIMERGIQNIGNIKDAVLAEAKLVLQLDDQDEDEEVMQDSIYEHMPISAVDDFVGWATSHRGNDDNARPPNSTLRAHESAETPPPMPSQIAFLRKILENKLLDRMKQLHPNETLDSTYKRTRDVMDRLDQSALVAIQISIEDALTSAMIQLAKVCAEQQSHINHRQNESDENGRTAFTLPITEAIAKLSRDKSTNPQHKALLLNVLNECIISKSASTADVETDVANGTLNEQTGTLAAQKATPT